MTHICVGKLTIIGWDNGLSPERRQAMIWTNAGILSIGPLGTNFSEILIEIQTFSLKKIRLKMSSAKCCSFRLGLNVLRKDSRIAMQVMATKASCSIDLILPVCYGTDGCDDTVYPKKYAHGFVVLCFVVVMQSFIMNSHEVFIHIHQGCFAGTGAIVRLPQC